MKSPGDAESISLIWIWKAITIKSLGPFSDIHMLSSNWQTIYVILRCSIVLASFPIKVPPSYVQRAAAWSFQDPILLSNCLTLRHCEAKFLWTTATVTLLCLPHLIWGRVNSWFFTQKVDKTLCWPPWHCSTSMFPKELNLSKERQETTARLLASRIIPNPCMPRFEELLNPGGLTKCNLAFALFQQWAIKLTPWTSSSLCSYEFTYAPVTLM